MGTFLVETDQGTFEVDDGVAAQQEPTTPGLFGSSIGENSGWLKAARTPAAMMRQGGAMVSDQSFLPPHESVAVNVMRNLPGTIADIGANLGAAAIEPESFIGSGILKGAKMLAPTKVGQAIAKPIKATGRWIGEQAEKASGLAHKNPGVLAEATTDPSLMFGPGRTGSQVTYDAAKNAGNVIRPEFKQIADKKDLVVETLKALDDRGITTQEALYARKVLDDTKKAWAPEFYQTARSKLDKVAKQDFMGADAAHSRALKSESLRTAGSINKDKTSSVLRNVTMGMVPITAPVFSPAVQGLIASGVGVGRQAAGAAMRNPLGAGIGLSEMITNMRDKKEDKRGRERR